MCTVTHVTVLVKQKTHTHTGAFVFRGTLTDGTCGFLRGVRIK